MGLFASDSLFGQKYPQSSYYKNKVWNHCFFSLLLALSFSPFLFLTLTVVLEFLGFRKPVPFDAFSLK